MVTPRRSSVGVTPDAGSVVVATPGETTSVVLPPNS
jgi:hypothetical protein